MSVYKGIDQAGYDNESKYLNGLINSGDAGQKAWAQNQLKELNANKPVAQPTQPAVTNTTNNNNVNSVNNNAFIAPGSQVADDGTRFQSWGENDQYKKKDYLSGNADLQYALEGWMKKNGTNVYDVGGYVKELYGNVGQDRGDGSTVTLDDVNKELERLGLSDYNSQNVIHTAGNDFIPLNQYTQFKNGSLGGSNSPDSEWVSYAGRDYLIGGDNADFVNYVNAMTGNMTGADLLFDDMANNPYAKENADFAQWYQNMLNGFNNAAGVQAPSTGYDKVDQIINYGNALSGYNQATGGSMGGISLLDMLQSYLNGGLEANQNFINQQRAYAEQQAQQQASDAFVNKVLAGDALKQQLSALGLGTSGAVQSAQMGVQGEYGNNLAQINNNLAQMLNGLSEQELQVLSDYYNNMANYAYKVTNDEADRAYRNAQLALQQQQARYDEAYRQQQLAMQQAQWELEQQQYNDALKQQEFENDLALKKLAASKTGGGNNGGGNGVVLDNPIIDDTKDSGEVSYPILPSMLYQGSAGNGLLDRLNAEKQNQIAEQYKAADIGAMMGSNVVMNPTDYYHTDPQMLNQFGSQLSQALQNAKANLLDTSSTAMLEGESYSDYIKRMQSLGYM